MRPFELSQPRELPAAIAAIGGHTTARYIAGGTTLLDLMKLDVEQPDRLVDLTRLEDPALRAITRLPDGGIRLGALSLNSDVANHPLVRTSYPMLSQALLSGASGQIRNMATTGGNLLQRTRCWYFRDTAMSCNKRAPGSGCSAIEGENRIHAVLGTSSSCIAAHPSDMCVPLVALAATVRVRGSTGEREIPIAEFHLLPEAHPERENRLEPGDVVTAIDIPALAMAKRSVYVKVRDRASYQFALTSAAVAVEISGGVVSAARIALGGVGTRPWRAAAAERGLVGLPATDTSWRSAAEAAFSGAVPHRDNAFKIALGKRTIVRALRGAAALT